MSELVAGESKDLLPANEDLRGAVLECAQYWDRETQEMKLVEEAGELLNEIGKSRMREHRDRLPEKLEEAVDLYFVLLQLIHLWDLEHYGWFEDMLQDKAEGALRVKRMQEREDRGPISQNDDQ